MNQQKYLPHSTKIFENKNVWVTLLKVMLPNVLSALVNNLYAIVTQIFLNKIVPFDKVHDNVHLWKNYNAIHRMWYGGDSASLQWKGGSPLLPLETSANVVHSAVAISLPIVIGISAIALWISLGLSILYGTTIGKKKTAEAQRIWTAWFWPTLVFCGVISLVLSLCLSPLLTYSAGANQVNHLDFLNDKLSQSLNGEQQRCLNGFYRTYYQAIVHSAFTYLLPMIVTLFLQVFVIGTWFCLAAEGKQMMMLTVSIICNLLNVGLDFCLMYFAKIGMLSGGLVVAITFSINCSILLTYISYLNKRSATLITLNIFRFTFGWMIFWSILIAGLASLLQNIIAAFSIWIFHVFLIKTTNSVKQHPTTYWLNFSGAVMPIQNLLSQTANGIVQATRILFAYHLPAQNLRYVKKIFWVGTLYALILTGILFGLVANSWAGLGLMHSLFGINIANPTVARDALIYWQFILSGIMMIGFSQIGIVFFQVAGRVLNAPMLAIISGIFVSLMVLPLLNVMAVHFHSDLIYLGSWPLSWFIGGLFVFIYSVVYLHAYLKPGYQVRNLFTQKQLN